MAKNDVSTIWAQDHFAIPEMDKALSDINRIEPEKTHFVSPIDPRNQDERLLSAVSAGDREKADDAISRGARFEAIAPNLGMTPLGIAYALGHLNLVDLFKQRGADSAKRDNYGKQAIDYRALSNQQRLEFKEKLNVFLRHNLAKNESQLGYKNTISTATHTSSNAAMYGFFSIKPQKVIGDSPSPPKYSVEPYVKIK